MKNFKWIPNWLFPIIRKEQLDRASDEEIRNTFHLTNERIAQAVRPLKKELDPIGIAIQNTLPAVGTVWCKNETESWNGSGFLIANGRFITAAHVTRDAIEIQVTFDEKEIINSNVITADKNIDTAILKIDKIPENIQPLKFASPKNIRIGEQIAVIGSPEGWHNVATAGRISAMNKTFQQPGMPSLQNFILIDADVDPGSSGAPVIDTDGRVVGIVMALIGKHADLGLGQRAVCPVEKILNLIIQTH
jgi:S1-C subfamily serine protease